MRPSLTASWPSSPAPGDVTLAPQTQGTDCPPTPTLPSPPAPAPVPALLSPRLRPVVGHATAQLASAAATAARRHHDGATHTKLLSAQLNVAGGVHVQLAVRDQRRNLLPENVLRKGVKRQLHV